MYQSPFSLHADPMFTTLQSLLLFLKIDQMPFENMAIYHTSKKRLQLPNGLVTRWNWKSTIIYQVQEFPFQIRFGLSIWKKEKKRKRVPSAAAYAINDYPPATMATKMSRQLFNVYSLVVGISDGHAHRLIENPFSFVQINEQTISIYFSVKYSDFHCNEISIHP